jgi:hypothetical protein
VSSTLSRHENGAYDGTESECEIVVLNYRNRQVKRYRDVKNSRLLVLSKTQECAVLNNGQSAGNTVKNWSEITFKNPLKINGKKK